MDLKKAKIFLTGGMGFIGSHIADLLVSKKAKVTIYDNFSSGFWSNIKKIRNKVEVIRGDILDYKKLSNAMKGFDVVVHQAAQLEISRCIEDPIEDLTVNTIGSLNVLKSCVENQVKKVVLASSAGVYGQLVKSPQKEDFHPTNPNWQYGVSKLAVEKYANIFNEMYGLPIVSLRYAKVFGPREWWGSVLTVFLKKAFEGKPLIVFGDGKQVRDWVYVGDIARLNLLAIQKDYPQHLILNGSTNRKVTVAQLAQTIKKISGKSDLKIVYDKKTKEGQMCKEIGRMRLPSELKAMVMSYQKAKKFLGWEPKINLEEGIRREYSWLEENHHLWKKIKI